jgi:ArsR family transcriptional regulator
MTIEASRGELALMFKALGDPTRLGIFQTLRSCAAGEEGVAVGDTGECRPAGSLSVGEVCCRFGGSMSTISHHLRELRLAALIRTEKRGRWIYCSVNPAAAELMRAFLDAAPPPLPRAGSLPGLDPAAAGAACCAGSGG